MAQIKDNEYRAASGAKVFTVDPAAHTVQIATRHRGQSEIHSIAVETVLKMIYGERAVVVKLPEDIHQMADKDEAAA